MMQRQRYNLEYWLSLFSMMTIAFVLAAFIPSERGLRIALGVSFALHGLWLISIWERRGPPWKGIWRREKWRKEISAAARPGEGTKGKDPENR